jgi:hypothetical protein
MGQGACATRFRPTPQCSSATDRVPVAAAVTPPPDPAQIVQALIARSARNPDNRQQSAGIHHDFGLLSDSETARKRSPSALLADEDSIFCKQEVTGSIPVGSIDSCLRGGDHNP